MGGGASRARRVGVDGGGGRRGGAAPHRPAAAHARALRRRGRVNRCVRPAAHRAALCLSLQAQIGHRNRSAQQAEARAAAPLRRWLARRRRAERAMPPAPRPPPAPARPPARAHPSARRPRGASRCLKPAAFLPPLIEKDPLSPAPPRRASRAGARGWSVARSPRPRARAPRRGAARARASEARRFLLCLAFQLFAPGDGGAARAPGGAPGARSIERRRLYNPP